MVKITEALVRKKSEHNELLISTLEELSLHQEDIERIEHFHSWCRDLKILLLQSNLIAKIENLYKLKKLEYLNLAINNVERVENLEKLESLKKLDLTLNFIGELTSLESLRDNYNLRELILTGNPCCDYSNYREYVIATLPQLNNLDCTEITPTEKLQARQKLKQYRAVIVQKQADYAIKRDEQKIRFVQQKEELESKMASIDDEDERVKTFWQSKSEHSPEMRAEIARFHKICRDKSETTNNQERQPKRRAPQLFAPSGRPYNINQAKLPFTFKDEAADYILELDVYKHLDTSYINVDVESNYIRVNVKGKIFQISVNEEINIPEATVQRSQITGQLMVRTPKLHYNELLAIKAPKSKHEISTALKERKSCSSLKDVVDIANICNSRENELPELI